MDDGDRPIDPGEDKAQCPEPTEAELEVELLKLARSRESATKIQAQGAALRTALRRRQHEREAAERVERRSRRAGAHNRDFEWPSDTPDERAPAVGYWPRSTQEEFDADPFAELDVAAGDDTFGFRDAWRARVDGPPPWRRRTAAKQRD